MKTSMLMMTIFLTVLALTGSAAQVYNYPGRFIGTCYAAEHYSQADSSNPQTTSDAYAKDFPVIAAQGFNVVRCYMLADIAHYLNFVGEAYRNKLKVVLEVPVDPNASAQTNQDAISAFTSFLTNVNATPESKKGQKCDVQLNQWITINNVDYVSPSMFSSTVILVLTGNENIPAANDDSQSIITLKTQISQALSQNGFPTVPVTYDFQCDVWTADPNIYPNRTAIINSLDPGVPILVNSYPFQWGADVGQAVTGGSMSDSLQDWVNRIISFYPAGTFENHPIIFGETGWPSAGTWQSPNNGLRTGTLADEATYMGLVYNWVANNAQNAKTLGGVLIFEAFDQSTKPGQDSEQNYGLWYGGTPAQIGTWKQGIPAPPSILSANFRGAQGHLPGFAHGNSAKSDSLNLFGLWIHEDFTDLTHTGLEVSIDGNRISMPAEKFTVKDGTYKYDYDGIKFNLGSDFKWRLAVKTDLENIDSRDDLDVSFEFGDMQIQSRIAPNENTNCIFRKGVNGSELLEVSGTPMKSFAVEKAHMIYNWRSNKVSAAIFISFRLPDGTEFAPENDIVTISCEEYDVAIPAGSFKARKGNVYSYTHRYDDGGLNVILDFDKHLCKIKFVHAGRWNLFSPGDGIEFFLTVGACQGGIRFDPGQHFLFKYKAHR
jgi:exo-beta-1,3-glucanase (GH17 family)